MSLTNTSAALALALGFGVAGCATDPQYVDPEETLEVNAPGTMDTGTAMTTIDLPIRLEEEDEATERAELAADLGVEVPYVKMDDIHVSIEWSIENLSEERGEATILVNGATELASFVPTNFVVDPEEDEEPPPLMGGVPYILEGGETLTGVFREVQIREGSVDLELMYRQGYNPFAAVLEQHLGMDEMTDMSGAVVPREVFASMIRFDIIFSANRNMLMRYAIRVRDERGILHEKLLNPDDPGELTQFMPVEITPPMMPME